VSRELELMKLQNPEVRARRSESLSRYHYLVALGRRGPGSSRCPTTSSPCSPRCF
jgi:hypothetical protein